MATGIAMSGKSERWSARLAAARGALRDRHGRWKRDAMDAACRETNDMTRTTKSCGPGAPMQVPRFARWRKATVTTKPGLTGESTKEAV